MAATDGQILVAAARWADEGSYLREFVPHARLPALVKFSKGQYAGLGVPTLPSPGLQPAALLLSAGRRRQIVAQAVKLKDGRRLVSVGPRLAIPESYPGWFELLSEEGRAVRCVEGVAELARRRLAACLVREPLRALLGRAEPDGSVSAGAARGVAAGETLVPEGETLANGAKGRFLRCTDSRGDTLLLGLEQRGRFSALAREDNISGVHTARNLLAKRFPLTVRLVHGTPPRGLKSAGHFVPELRLIASFEEEHIFALPLQKEANALTALPLAAPLKLQRCRNDEQIRNFMEFSRLVDKCGRLLADVTDKMHVLDGKLGDPKRAAPAKSGYFLRRSASSDSAGHGLKAGLLHRGHLPAHLPAHLPTHGHAPREDLKPAPDEYDDIDQIYDYVRGFAPLPKNVKSPFASEALLPRHESAPTSPVTTPIHMPLLTDSRPEPPPIETIPGKKPPSAPAHAGKAEKRTRKAAVAPLKEAPPVIVYKEKCSIAPASNNLPKLYIKNGGNSQRTRIAFRQKSSSPVKELPPSPLPSPGLNPLKGGSPLFNIRYKSLSNLHQAMELDGTLDSSHSGGRTSGDSGAGAKVPEKRSRRLSRPKSLTNLVWELRGCQDPSHDRPKAKPRQEAVVYRKSANKLSLSGQKRVGTLYL